MGNVVYKMTIFQVSLKENISYKHMLEEAVVSLVT